jgi:hypothetical protein
MRPGTEVSSRDGVMLFQVRSTDQRSTLHLAAWTVNERVPPATLDPAVASCSRVDLGEIDQCLVDEVVEVRRDR